MRIENENIRELAPTGVRIPPNLKERIKLAAKEKSHSVNAEIIERLQELLGSVLLNKKSGVRFGSGWMARHRPVVLKKLPVVKKIVKNAIDFIPCQYSILLDCAYNPYFIKPAGFFTTAITAYFVYFLYRKNATLADDKNKPLSVLLKKCLFYGVYSILPESDGFYIFSDIKKVPWRGAFNLV